MISAGVGELFSILWPSAYAHIYHSRSRFYIQGVVSQTEARVENSIPLYRVQHGTEADNCHEAAH